MEARLRGDADDAVVALADQLRATPPDQRTALLIRYADDPSPSLRYAAVDGLASLKKPECADTIARAFTDNSSQVRQRAVEVLHEVDPDRGLELLRTGLRDEDQWIREAAVMQLVVVLRNRRLFTLPITASLIDAMNPEDPVVCRTCAFLLSRQTGKPWRIKLGMTATQQQAIVGKWRRWWQAERERTANMQTITLPDPVIPLRADRAPDFKVRDLDRRTWSLEGQRGRLTLLHFWGSWCDACRVELTEMARLDRDFRARGLDIIALAVAENDPGVIRRVANQYGATFPLGIAPRSVTEAFAHIHEVPVSVLIDRRGMIRYRWDGERDYATFAKAVMRIAAE